MGKNGYLQRQKNTVDAYRKAERQTYVQFMVDTLVLTLNDPEVMGKDTFGAKRIRNVVNGWMDTFDLYHGALEKGDEQDFWQIKLDQNLKAILGEEGFDPFSKRYDWVKEA